MSSASYPVLLTIHLFCALIFVGTVFFEVLVLEGVRKHVPAEAMRAVERGIGRRVRWLMPIVLVTLFSAGFGLAAHYGEQLTHPAGNPFAILLMIKIGLALSVFGHFLLASYWRMCEIFTARRSRLLHISVFCHVVLIVLLAKGMFHIQF